MKFKYLLSGFMVSTLLLSSCVEVDETRTLDGVGTQQLTVKGFLVNGYTDEIPSVIDNENHLITVQVPYYISDTERIMGDITQMKLEALTPVGYKFSPVLSGIHDLSVPFHTNLIDNHGKATPYTIIAEPTYSNASSVTSVELTEADRAAIVIKEPATPGDHGTVLILKTSSSIEAALHSAIVKVSPWSTIETTGYDPETGIFDLSSLPTITVTAQNGVDKTVYDVKFDYPQIKDYGVGYSLNLFGFQATVQEPHGMEAGANTSMAVVGDYLILSNRLDVNKMPIYDRFTGKLLENVHVNTTGMQAGREYRAICHDDAGHLVAATWTNTNVNYGGPTADSNVYIYAWENGIENAPKCIFIGDLNGGYFKNAPQGINGAKAIIFNTIACRGNVFSGKSVITTATMSNTRCVLMPFENGRISTTQAFVEWAGNGVGAVSMWYSTKCTPLTVEEPFGYIWDNGMSRMGLFYIPEGAKNLNRCIFLEQPTSHWWKGTAPGAAVDWGGSVRSNSAIDFNGARVFATANGRQFASKWAYRLYVADIGMTPNGSSLSTGFIFDSREGGPNGTDDVAGTGYSPAGMTSAGEFVSGTTVLGPNALEFVDVIFARSDDGNSIQVYMLVGDQGLMGYELTRFDI